MENLKQPRFITLRTTLLIGVAMSASAITLISYTMPTSADLKEDFCVSAELIEDQSVTARFGNCPTGGDSVEMTPVGDSAPVSSPTESPTPSASPISSPEATPTPTPTPTPEGPPPPPAQNNDPNTTTFLFCHHGEKHYNSYNGMLNGHHDRHIEDIIPPIPPKNYPGWQWTAKNAETYYNNCVPK